MWSCDLVLANEIEVEVIEVTSGAFLYGYTSSSFILPYYRPAIFSRLYVSCEGLGGGQPKQTWQNRRVEETDPGLRS